MKKEFLLGQVGRKKLILGSTLVALMGVVVGAVQLNWSQVALAQRGSGDRPGIVVGEEFRLVDKNGKDLARLAPGVNLGGSILSFFDREGRMRAVLNVTGDGGVSMRFMDSKGADLVTLGTTTDHELPIFRLADGSGKPIVEYPVPARR